MNLFNLKSQANVPKNIRDENLTLFSAVTLAWSGISASFPFIAIYLLQVRDLPLSQVGIIYLASGVLGLIVQIIGGRLSDFLGTKVMALVGLSLSGLIFALLSLFVAFNSPVSAFMISYPILGLFNGFFQTAFSSYISDRKPGQVSSGMSLMYVGLNLGFTIGPISGGFLVTYVGYSYIFAFGAVTSIAAAALTFIRIKTNPRYAQRSSGSTSAPTRRRRLERGLFPFFVLIFFSWMAIGYQAVPLSVYEAQFLTLSNIGIGLVLTTNGLLITILQMPISRWIGIENKLRLLPVAVGSAIMGGGYFLIANSQTLIPLVLAIVITTIGEMMVAVPTQVVVAMFSKENNRGEYQGLFYAFSRTGASFAFYLGPLVFSIFIASAYLGWYIVGGISLATGIGYYLLSPVIKKEYETNQSARVQEVPLGR